MRGECSAQRLEALSERGSLLNQVRTHSALVGQTAEESAVQAPTRGASPRTPLALLPKELIST